MKYLPLLLTAALMAANVTAQNKSKIRSALGMKLGATHEIDEDDEPQRELDGSELYPFKPPKQIKPFTEYLVEVTPKTNKISQIWATVYFRDIPEARRERDALLAALEKKYGQRAGESDRHARLAAMHSGYVIKSGVRMIMLLIMEKDGKYRLMLKYVDRILKDQAKQERIKLEKESGEGAGMGQAL